MVIIDKSYNSEYENVAKNLFVNYIARCNEYKNIKCTKYVLQIEYTCFGWTNNQIYNNFISK